MQFRSFINLVLIVGIKRCFLDLKFRAIIFTDLYLKMVSTVSDIIHNFQVFVDVSFFFNDANFDLDFFLFLLRIFSDA